MITDDEQIAAALASLNQTNVARGRYRGTPDNEYWEANLDKLDIVDRRLLSESMPSSWVAL